MIMLGGLGPTEILLIFLALLLLFGAKKIPDLARGLGSGIVEFKNSLREVSTENTLESSVEEQSK
jgi:sec-independent protein translocase protein TatA